jgi:hypothetical protein
MWEVRDSSLTELSESIRDVTRQILPLETSPLLRVTWEQVLQEQRQVRMVCISNEETILVGRLQELLQRVQRW